MLSAKWMGLTVEAVGVESRGQKLVPGSEFIQQSMPHVFN